MFATVMDSAKMALMGKHANKTVHSDVYFQHFADYCLKIFYHFYKFYYSEFAHKTFKEKHGTRAETRVLQILFVCAPKWYMYGIHDISSKRSSSKRHFV